MNTARITIRLSHALVRVVLALGVVKGADAQVVHERLIVSRDDSGLQGNAFARCIAVDGEYVVVGAQGDATNGLGSGAVYIFDTQSGRRLHKLTPETGAAHDIFGSSLDIDNGLLVVGSREDDVRGKASGSAYLFDAATGEELHKFKMDDGKRNDRFGTAIAIADGIVAISAPGDFDDSAPDDPGVRQAAGSVYLFDMETRELRGKIYANSSAEHNGFGREIAIGGGVIAVASPSLVQVFDINTRELLTDIRPESNITSRYFARSIAIAGSELLVSAIERDRLGFETGVVYIYDSRTGERTGVLKPSDSIRDNFFGTRIDTSGEFAVIGAPGDRTNGHMAGAAYIFRVPERDELAKLLPSDGVEFRGFSRYSIAFSEGIIAAGTFDHDTNQGEVYLFDMPPVSPE